MALDILSYEIGKKSGGSGGTTNYNELSNKPSINDIELSGNKTTSDLGLFGGNYNDLTNKPTIPDVIQTTTLPTASVDNLGKIMQYTGTTDSTYTNGYFYQVVSDGQATPTYSWENINVQAGGGSLAPRYIEDGDGNKLYFANYSTDSTYKTNILIPIVQAIVDDYKNGKKSHLYLINKDDTNMTGIYELGTKYGSYYKFYSTYCDFKEYTNETNKNRLYIGNRQFSANYTGNDIITDVVGFYSNDSLNIYYLSTNRNYSSAFIPTNDGHPATKKYVDDKPTSYTGYDATKTQVLKNINGTLTWVDES